MFNAKAFNVKMNKKAVSLSLETVVVAILVLIVLVLVAFFIIKYGGQLIDSLGNQAQNVVSTLPEKPTP